MKRIMLIGSGGAGKSTLALKIAPILKLPLIHLDTEFWSPGWVEPDKVWWRKRVKEIADGEKWIIDGNYGGTMDIRLERADTIIFMDYPTWLRLLRVIWRYWKNRNKSRPDMREGCPEKLDWQFMLYIANYNKSRKPVILEKLAKLQENQKIIILKNDKETRSFVQSLIQTHAKS